MENEKQLVSVDRVYFDKEAGYFKFREPSPEDIGKMKKFGESGDYDASDYFFEIFSQMEDTINENYENGYIDGEMMDVFTSYLDQTHMSFDYEGIDFFEGRDALYRVLPENYYFDKLRDGIREGNLPGPISEPPFFAQTYYNYSISHGQTPQQFFSKFFELKRQNEMKANLWLEQKLNERTERLQPQVQEYVESPENIVQQASENEHIRGAR